MESEYEEFVTKEDSEIDEDSDSPASRGRSVYIFGEYPYMSSDTQEDTDSEDSEDPEENDNKRLKVPSASSTKENSDEEEEATKDVEEKGTKLLWSTKNLKPKLHKFDEKNSGVRVHLTAHSTPLDAFLLFLSEDLVALIASETNKYYKHLMEQEAYKSHPRLSAWRDTTVPEMYAFLCIMMTTTQVDNYSFDDFWSPDSLLTTNIFSEIMTCDRFTILLQMLHFSDNNIVNTEDPLTKVRPVLDRIKTLFSQFFYPFKDLHIDKSFSLYKGRSCLNRYIQWENDRLQMKSFALIDCKTGYVQDIIIRTESADKENVESLPKYENIVMPLLQPYFGKGHTLIVDFRFTSPCLFTSLHECQINAYGGVKATTAEMPTIEEKLQKGTCTYRSTENLLALKWAESRKAWTLTTSHSAEMVITRRGSSKKGSPKKVPKCIMDYNSMMASLERLEIDLSIVATLKDSVKWYKKYFLHLLDLSIYNAYVLHRMVTGRKLAFAQFHKALTRGILDKYPPSEVPVE